MIKDREGNRYYIIRNPFGTKIYKVTPDNRVVYTPSILEQMFINMYEYYSSKQDGYVHKSWKFSYVWFSDIHSQDEQNLLIH
jgi:hypothetical protein